jgi:replication-associated recombination protein RarA
MIQATSSCQPLFEEFRPTSWEAVIGQDAALRKVGAIRRRGLGGRAYWLSGKSGTGKTTIARLLAGEFADEFAIDELDAERLTATRIATEERRTAGAPLGGKGWALIINEAHGLSASAIRQLLTWIERLPAHVVLIFTTTREGEADLFGSTIDASPLLSRCVELALTCQGLRKAFATMALAIAKRADLIDPALTDSDANKRLERLAKETSSNARAMLQQIETGYLL